MAHGKPHNPFSSYLVEPAVGGYIFTGGVTLDELCHRLEAVHWRGTLVGPCGAGKSTLLSDICRVLSGQGVMVARCQCNNESRSLPLSFMRDMARAQVVAIDGSEQLFAVLLWFSRMFTRLTGKGLLVTAHKSAGPGLIIPITPSLEALTSKVAALLAVPATAVEGRVAELFRHHSGNAREVLFDLYIQFEAGTLPGQESLDYA